jgi:hypothetical protein
LPLPEPEPSVAQPSGEEPGWSDSGQSLSRMLAAFAWPVMALGLFLPESGVSAFGRSPAWSVFALFCLVFVGIGAFGGREGPGAGRTYTLGVIGAGGLGAFWVLLVLPEIHRNTSFVLTLGTTLAAFAIWLASGCGRG